MTETSEAAPARTHKPRRTRVLTLLLNGLDPGTLAGDTEDDRDLLTELLDTPSHPGLSNLDRLIRKAGDARVRINIRTDLPAWMG